MLLDTIKSTIESQLLHTKNALAAWNEVKIVAKKDGTPFKTMGKNFEGAMYRIRYGFFDLSVTYSVYPNGIKSERDSVSIFHEDPTVEEFIEEIEKRKCELEKYAREGERNLEQAEAACIYYEGAMAEVKHKLAEICGGENNLYYEIRNHYDR